MERLGRYELHSALGEGGMGVVWDAELVGPAGFRKPVALKVLKGSGAGLVQEARLGGMLRHPNLVEVYALEQVDGQWICAMELVRGGTLARYGSLPPAAVVDVGLQVCAGLQHAHEAIGLIHLDIKPANLLLDGATVKVADLGISRARGFDGTRRVLGTPAYMAPEQRRGQPVDGRTDIWALGVVLYELATGRRPRFESAPAETWTTMEVTEGVEADDWVLAAVVDDVPWLAPILRRCLATEAEDRYASMAELALALCEIDVPEDGLAELLGVAAPLGTGRSTASQSLTLTRPPEPTRTNLAAAIDRFVGREAELTRLTRAVEDSALVTLKGPGGCGKTRLIQRFGLEWLGRGDEAWFVDLSQAFARLDVLRAVAEVLGVPLGAGSADVLAEQLGHALAQRGRVLVILDNFEQVVTCADLVWEWREQAPDACFVVTSREPLRLKGERVLRVEPLPEHDAVALLVARAADRGRDLIGDPALPELARRLDGLPLALELAAARLVMMSPQQVLQRLDRRLQLLSGGRGKQATLRGTLDWSWDLLDPVEQQALAQLSSFRGGFTLEAAEAVLELPPGSPWALDVVDALVERSLVSVRSRASGTRFDLLESVRVYADEKLTQPDRQSAWTRHGRRFAEFGADEHLREGLSIGGLDGWSRLSVELDNLVAACERAVDRDDGPTAVQALRGATEVLDVRGPYQAIVELGALVDPMVLEPALRGRLDLVIGRAMRRVGSSHAALERFEAAKATFEALGDRFHVGNALNQMGNLARIGGRPAEGLAMLREAEAAYKEAGDERSQAVVWGNQANCHFVTGDVHRARTLYERALEVRRRFKDQRGVAHVLTNLAVVEQMDGKLGASRRHYEASLRVQREIGDRRGEALNLANLGSLECDLQNFGVAERRFERALEIRRSLGARRGVGIVLGYLSLTDVEFGRFESARERALEALALYRAIGARRHEGNMVGQLAGIAVLEERFDDAGRLLTQATEVQREVNDRIGLATSLYWRGRLQIRQSEFEAATSSFDEAAGLQRGRHEAAWALSTAWRGLSLARQGDLDGARTDLDAATEGLRVHGVGRGLAECLMVRALALSDAQALATAEPRVPDLNGSLGILFARAKAWIEAAST